MFLTPVVDLVDELTAGGIPATYDPRTLAVPGAIVTPEQSTPAGLHADDVELTVTLLAPGPANGAALAKLDELDTAARAVLGAVTGRLVGYEHPATGETLAGWQYTLTRART